jgi:hypothetical protein
VKNKQLKSPPSTINLPGGIRAAARDFVITEVDMDNRPIGFRLARPGENSDCVLWATDGFMNFALAPELHKRFYERKAQKFITNTADVTQPGASVGYHVKGETPMRAPWDGENKKLCPKPVFVDDGWPMAQCRKSPGHMYACAPLEEKPKTIELANASMRSPRRT